jgi:hypothetical protein
MGGYTSSDQVAQSGHGDEKGVNVVLDPHRLGRAASEAHERVQPATASRATTRAAEPAERVTKRHDDLAKAYAAEKSRLECLDVQAQTEQLVRDAAAYGCTAAELTVGEYAQREAHTDPYSNYSTNSERVNAEL